MTDECSCFHSLSCISWSSWKVPCEWGGGLEEKRDGLMAEEVECCSGEVDSLFVSEKELHPWLHILGYSASRLLVIPEGTGLSLNPCKFNGCRRIRQKFVQFPMNRSKFSPQGNAFQKINHAHNEARKAQLDVLACRTWQRLKPLYRLNCIFLLR